MGPPIPDLGDSHFAQDAGPGPGPPCDGVIIGDSEGLVSVMDPDALGGIDGCDQSATCHPGLSELSLGPVRQQQGRRAGRGVGKRAALRAEAGREAGRYAVSHADPCDPDRPVAIVN